MLRFDGAGVSDRGPVRELNEDAAFLGPWLALVADGVGGAAAGEIASATTAYVVARSAGRGVDPLLALDAGVRRALKLMRQASAADVELLGFATTLTGIALDGQRAALVHVGDSRAYLLRAGGMTRLTRDHTYVQQLVDDGYLPPEGVASHPWRHVVTRSLHAGEIAGDEQPEFTELTLLAGDRLILCSDGMTDYLSDARIADLASDLAPGSAAQGLVQVASLAGATDNVTCLVVDVLDLPDDPEVTVLRGRAPAGERFGSLLDDSNVLGATRLTAY
jgi:serine/threonine protein phosphatase PrpC